MIEIRRYQNVDGREPLTDWLGAMRDARARARLEIRFQRAAIGMLGDIKPVGEGVLELREDVGPGYRVYLGRHGAVLIILLCGGDKRFQERDIKHAKACWRDWKRRNR